jgi:hypothetical protein
MLGRPPVYSLGQLCEREVRGTGLRRVLEIMKIVKPRTMVVLRSGLFERKDKRCE